MFSVSFLFKRCSVTQTVSNPFLHHHTAYLAPWKSNFGQRQYVLVCKHNVTNLQDVFVFHLLQKNVTDPEQSVEGGICLPVLGQTKARRDY